MVEIDDRETKKQKQETEEGHLLRRAAATAAEEMRDVVAIVNHKQSDSPFLLLPLEVVINIFQYLSPLQADAASKVCRRWRKIITKSPNTELVWKLIYSHWFGAPLPTENPPTHKKLCTTLCQHLKDKYGVEDLANVSDKEEAGSIICWAARRGHIATIRRLSERFDKEAITMMASKWYLQKETGKIASALFLAAQENRLDICKMLINFVEPDSSAPDDGSTSLLIASQNGHIDIVKLLLSCGANPNRKAEVSPLYIACQNGHVRVAEMLIDAGADVESKHERGGATPLFIASQNGHLEVVHLLIKKGASPVNPRNDGTTPQMIASRARQDTIVAFLAQQTAVRA